MKNLMAISTLALAMLSFSAHAYTANCVLIVKGKTYIHGDCNFEPFNDGTGSYSIGTDSNSEYFAYVYVAKDGSATASWNGDEGASHAQIDLGPLKRDGACRFNDQAIICAWAK